MVYTYAPFKNLNLRQSNALRIKHLRTREAGEKH